MKPIYENLAQYILVALLIGLVLALVRYLLGFSKEPLKVIFFYKSLIPSTNRKHAFNRNNEIIDYHAAGKVLALRWRYMPAFHQKC